MLSRRLIRCRRRARAIGRRRRRVWQRIMPGVGASGRIVFARRSCAAVKPGMAAMTAAHETAGCRPRKVLGAGVTQMLETGAAQEPCMIGVQAGVYFRRNAVICVTRKIARVAKSRMTAADRHFFKP